MIDIEIVRHQIAEAYISIARMRSMDPDVQAKIMDLQLAMENVQTMFTEIFP